MDGVVHHGVIMPLERKYQIMANASCFLIPSSFNSKFHKNYKFSFPTKIPELIATGRPILSYGPAETSTNRILEKQKLGFRVHNRSIESLTNTLTSIIENFSNAVVKSQESKKFASQNYAASKMRKN